MMAGSMQQDDYLVELGRKRLKQFQKKTTKKKEAVNANSTRPASDAGSLFAPIYQPSENENSRATTPTSSVAAEGLASAEGVGDGREAARDSPQDDASKATINLLVEEKAELTARVQQLEHAMAQMASNEQPGAGVGHFESRIQSLLVELSNAKDALYDARGDRDRAAAAVETLQVHMQEQDAFIGELQQELAVARRQSQVPVTTERAGADILGYQMRILEVEKSLEAKDAKIEELYEQLRRQEASMRSLEEENVALKEEMDILVQEGDEVRAAMVEASQRVQMSEDLLEQERRQRSLDLQSSHIDVAKEVKESSVANLELQEQVAAKERALQEARVVVATQAREKEDLMKRIGSFSQRVADLQVENKSLMDHLAELRTRNIELNDQKAEALDELYEQQRKSAAYVTFAVSSEH
ncbi:hypothetical protein HK101_010725 [Irineochytrium annulatum]|nr:hypothetical protein HK101_010725 [Irineochytrium annulatum]